MEKPIQLENFSGPLDLLLQLIEDEKLAICDVSLSQVTEQFLSYLEEVQECLPEELADFLVIATRLLLLKSNALLPYLNLEEEEDPGELAAQLRMYKKYAEATHFIEDLLQQRLFLYGKKVVKQPMREVEFHPPVSVGNEQLRQLFVDVLEKLEPVVRIPKTALQKVVTLREKLGQIQGLLERQITMNFREMLADADDREEVVVTFLAILELVKQQTVHVRQNQSFTEIIVEKIN